MTTGVRRDLPALIQVKLSKLFWMLFAPVADTWN